MKLIETDLDGTILESGSEIVFVTAGPPRFVEVLEDLLGR